MRRYEKYSPSNIEWLGEIPSNWGVNRLKYTAAEGQNTFQDGDWIESNVIVEFGEFRYITTGNIGEGKYKEQGRSFISRETFQNLECLEIFPGDLLISRLNHPIGRSCIIPDLGYRIVTSVDNVVLRPKKSFDKQYLVYVTNSARYYEYAGLIARGATMARVSRTLLGCIEIPEPPTKEQTAIANYLDEKTAQIDTLIDKKQNLIELLKEERKTIINNALSGEGKNWKRKKLKYLASMQGGFAFSSNDFVPEGIQLIKIANLYQNEFSLDRQPTYVPEIFANEYKDWLVREGDILMSMTGTLGKRDYGYAIQITNTNNKFLLNQRVSKIVFDETQLKREFGLLILRSDYFLDLLFIMPSGTKQGNFSNEQILSLTVSYPEELEEQIKILKLLENETARIDRIISQAQKETELIQEYKISLITEVVTGKVKVA